jgi:hypothetical protein
MLRQLLGLPLSVVALSLLVWTLPALAGPAEDARSAAARKDYSTALQLWSGLASRGDPEAQTEVGRMYGQGLGVPKDEATALRWYRAAAEKGYARAEYAIGLYYATGRAVEKNDSEAIKWYRKAAERGDPSAQNAVGIFYATGRAVEKNDNEANTWFRKAAEQGHASAQANLGMRYMSGNGIGRNYSQGILWLERAEQQGNIRAKAGLGTAYERGEGVKKDLGKALSLLNDALDRLSRAPDEKLKSWILVARDRVWNELRSSGPSTATRALPNRTARAPSASGGCEAGYSIDAVTGDGHIVTLDDGSIWEVDAGDWITSSLWLPASDIVACNHKLVNTDEGESVEAVRLR